MKTALILMLSLALLAAALLTRPDRRDLMLHVLDTRFGGNWSAAEVHQADQLVRGVTFHNRILWTDVERDGQVLYTGAFGQWFARSAEADRPLPSPAQLSALARSVTR
jgi:hypothetical protein